MEGNHNAIAKELKRVCDPGITGQQAQSNL